MGWLEAFDDRWIPEPNSGCYIWLGWCKNSDGNHPYPTVSVNHKPRMLCRLICKEYHGPPPTPMHQAAHKPPCNNTLCINPEHLYWATPSQNAADKGYKYGMLFHPNTPLEEIILILERFRGG